MTLVDSKYGLVVAVSKRARQLQDRLQSQPGSSITKNVSRALWEIQSQKMHYHRTKEEIK
ncbi:DNA-directed RNA polymerase subunit omega [Alicyclobacillaceae bacterium I2511]|nr:DNA-directed RNA polymerase subunit omega [Alicyclobacillaceae bacterium I2511]